jgi:hypothetical protein
MYIFRFLPFLFKLSSPFFVTPSLRLWTDMFSCSSFRLAKSRLHFLTHYPSDSVSVCLKACPITEAVPRLIYSILKMEALCASEIMLLAYNTTWCHVHIFGRWWVRISAGAPAWIFSVFPGKFRHYTSTIPLTFPPDFVSKPFDAYVV